MRKPTNQELDNYLRDTDEHIAKVQKHMGKAIAKLQAQATVHDLTKYSEDERDIYAVVVPEFSKYEYGTPEHDAVGDKLGPAWEHHKSKNPHHPGYHENGVDGMDLLYFVEMLCDWKAASERDPDQVFAESLEMNLEKYGITGTAANLMRNTAKRLGMI